MTQVIFQGKSIFSDFRKLSQHGRRSPPPSSREEERLDASEVAKYFWRSSGGKLFYEEQGGEVLFEEQVEEMFLKINSALCF